MAEITDYTKAGVDAAVAAAVAAIPEGVQDVVGAMVAAAGGTYDDAAGTITLPAGGGGDAFGEGVVPIFETLAQAEAWESANPGRVALTIEPLADTTAPTWPATLTVGAVTSTSVVINASALAADDRAVASYQVSLNGTAGPWSTAARSGPAFTVSGLMMGQTYASVKLRARDAAGNVSPELSVPSFTTPVAAPSDMAYQWVASDFTSGGWPDTVAGATLTGVAGPTLTGGEVVTSSVGWTAPLTLSAGAKTLVLVARLVSATNTNLHGYVGSSGPHAIAIPGGGGAKAGWYSHDGTVVKQNNVGGGSSVDNNKHVVVVRANGASSTLTVDRMTVAALGGTPSFATFQVGGNLHGYGHTHGTREIRIYDRRLSDAEVTALVTELGATHGIAL